jgi:hypothetical protein
MLKAYLEKCDKEWFDDFVYTARQPLVDRGFEIVPFNGLFLDEFIKKTSFNENDVIVGSVEATKAFWKKIGIEVPKYIGYPECLKDFYGREIKKTSLNKIKVEDLPIFIKPADDVKLFTGFVLGKNSTLRDINMYYPDVDPNTPVYTSEPINIISEYRCFVHKGNLVGIKHYDGDFNKFPNVDMINEMMVTYESSHDNIPTSYTLDVAIVEEIKEERYLIQLDESCMVGRKRAITNHKTLLIEINDFWAIGSYGLYGKTYVRLLIDRFQEIKNQKL